MTNKSDNGYSQYIKYKVNILKDFKITPTKEIKNTLASFKTHEEMDAYCQKLIDDKLGYKEKKGNWGRH